jgi:hypothetical protein
MHPAAGEGADQRGTVRLAKHLHQLDRLMRIRSPQARIRLEATLGLALTSQVLAIACGDHQSRPWEACA